MGQRQVDAEGETLLAEVLRLRREVDMAAVVEHLARYGNAERVIDVYSQAVLDSYWKDRDAAGVVAFGQAGMHYGAIAAAAAEAAGDAERAAKLRGAVKAIAYNLGSFTWPGWDEPGVVLTPSEVAAGMDAAKINLRLARELGRGDVPLSRAHWLVGAMHLAQGDREAALSAFREAQRHAEAASTQGVGDATLSRAYVALTQRLGTPDDATAVAAFDAARAALAKVKEGVFYVGQIDTAWRVFGPGGSWAQRSGGSGAAPRQ